MSSELSNNNTKFKQKELLSGSSLIKLQSERGLVFCDSEDEKNFLVFVNTYGYYNIFDFYIIESFIDIFDKVNNIINIQKYNDIYFTELEKYKYKKQLSWSEIRDKFLYQEELRKSIFPIIKDFELNLKTKFLNKYCMDLQNNNYVYFYNTFYLHDKNPLFKKNFDFKKNEKVLFSSNKCNQINAKAKNNLPIHRVVYFWSLGEFFEFIENFNEIEIGSIFRNCYFLETKEQLYIFHKYIRIARNFIAHGNTLFRYFTIKEKSLEAIFWEYVLKKIKISRKHDALDKYISKFLKSLKKESTASVNIFIALIILALFWNQKNGTLNTFLKKYPLDDINKWMKNGDIYW